MSTKYEPSPSDRKEAPEAFKYELEMFRLALERHSNEQVKQDNFFTNAMLECALLHARNLLDFFAGKISHKDDIIALHFVDNPLQLPCLENIRNNINKSLSHLTYTRVKVEKYKWDLPKISDEIERAYTEFLTFLPEEDKPKWRARDSDVELC